MESKMNMKLNLNEIKILQAGDLIFFDTVERTSTYYMKDSENSYLELRYFKKINEQRAHLTTKSGPFNIKQLKRQAKLYKHETYSLFILRAE